MPRNLAITKRVSLAGAYDGWTDDAYAIVTPASYVDRMEISNLVGGDKSNSELLQLELDLVKEHFVSGKLFVTDDAGNPQLDDMSADDLDEIVAASQILYMAITGITADPKGSSTETATSPTPTPTPAP